MRAGHRAEDQDQHRETEHVAVLFSNSCKPTSEGDKAAAAIPEPTTTVTTPFVELGDQPTTQRNRFRFRLDRRHYFTILDSIVMEANRG